VAPYTQRVEHFGNILHCPIASGLGHFVLKLWRKIDVVLRDSARYYGRGMKNWRISTNISLYFENDTRYGYSYNGRQ